MKAIALITGAILLSTAHAADSLFFSSGVVSNFSAVTLTLQGPTNLVCEVQRLNRTNQTWDVVAGPVNLGTSGSATVNSSLHEGIYGFFRCKSTNSAYLSTNAYGAVAGHLYADGKTMVGNLFAARDVSALIPLPVEGMLVYKWNTGSASWEIASYDFGEWNGPLEITTAEGVIVHNPATNTVRFLVEGLFTTNALSKNIGTGYSILASPLYHLTSGWQVDQFDTNQLGGNSLVPVQSSGFNPQCALDQMINTTGNYAHYILATNNVWTLTNVSSVIQIDLAEGFWLNKPTNATWSVSRTIW